LHLYEEAEIGEDRVRVGMGYIMLPAMLNDGKKIYINILLLLYLFFKNFFFFAISLLRQRTLKKLIYHSGMHTKV
jgi:hypothetical protein